MSDESGFRPRSRDHGSSRKSSSRHHANDRQRASKKVDCNSSESEEEIVVSSNQPSPTNQKNASQKKPEVVPQKPNETSKAASPPPPKLEHLINTDISESEEKPIHHIIETQESHIEANSIFDLFTNLFQYSGCCGGPSHLVSFVPSINKNGKKEFKMKNVD